MSHITFRQIRQTIQYSEQILIRILRFTVTKKKKIHVYYLVNSIWFPEYLGICCGYRISSYNGIYWNIYSHQTHCLTTVLALAYGYPLEIQTPLFPAYSTRRIDIRNRWMCTHFRAGRYTSQQTFCLYVVFFKFYF